MKHTYIHNNMQEFKNLSAEEKILIRTGQYEIPQTKSKEEAFSRIMMKISETQNNPDKTLRFRYRRIYYISSIAASILILLGLWFWSFRFSKENVIIGYGQQSEYRLPDGSLVALNAKSKISFSKNNFTKERYLKMKGEAFFEIAKGKTFTIKTSKAEIQILGTSFNIFDRKDYFKVSCFTGKVQVKLGDHSVILNPSESVRIVDEKLEKYSDKNYASSSDWRKGVFNYENIALKSIFEELERQFSVKFALHDINDKYFTGSFTNKNLTDALDIVCIPMGLTYEIGKNNKIFIKNASN